MMFTEQIDIALQKAELDLVQQLNVMTKKAEQLEGAIKQIKNLAYNGTSPVHFERIYKICLEFNLDEKRPK